MVISADRASWYLANLRADSDRLVEVARLGLDQEVPGCPGWTVEELVRHVAMVYLHKVEILRLGHRPDPWPLDWSDREPVEHLVEARDAVVEALTRAGTELATWTFSPEDQTSGFWYRRMALETVVHRVDAEQAHDVQTPIDPELALDGIDEHLTLTLGGPWWEEGDTAHPVDDTIRVTSAGRSWTIQLNATSVTVRPDAEGPVAAEVFGDPTAVYLSLWNRTPFPATNGSPHLLQEFQSRLAECTT